MKKSEIYFEARLNRNITRRPYGRKTIYKKGKVVYDCSDKQFSKLTASNIHKRTDLCLCEGHGVYEYFDLDKDIEFVKVEITTITKEKIVKLKK